MAYYPAHVTKIWERFEYYIARYRKCPECAGKLVVLPRNAGAVDCECSDCGCGVQVKFSVSGPKGHATPSSAREWKRCVRKRKARNIWFVTGNFRDQRWFKYTECRRRKSDRLRRISGESIAESKRKGRKLALQERFSFVFPAASKWLPAWAA
jgi:hypothetical protein